MGKTGPIRKRADVRQARQVRGSISRDIPEDYYDAQILALLWGKVPVSQRKEIITELMINEVDHAVDLQAIQVLLEEVHTIFHEATSH